MFQPCRELKDSYHFTSNRLGFRNWIESDILPLASINADKETMRFFPSVQSEKQTREFISRMQKQFDQKNYCYFAVDLIETSSFIGFIGLSDQNYPSDFTPCTDIGWRLDKRYWFKGYATEGAAACITHAKTNLNLPEIYAVASQINKTSIRVMEKIGMQYLRNFEHPLLIKDERLKNCVLYTKI